MCCATAQNDKMLDEEIVLRLGGAGGQTDPGKDRQETHRGIRVMVTRVEGIVERLKETKRLHCSMVG